MSALAYETHSDSPRNVRTQAAPAPSAFQFNEEHSTQALDSGVIEYLALLSSEGPAFARPGDRQSLEGTLRNAGHGYTLAAARMANIPLALDRDGKLKVSRLNCCAYNRLRLALLASS